MHDAKLDSLNTKCTALIWMIGILTIVQLLVFLVDRPPADRAESVQNILLKHRLAVCAARDQNKDKISYMFHDNEACIQSAMLKYSGGM